VAWDAADEGAAEEGATRGRRGARPRRRAGGVARRRRGGARLGKGARGAWGGGEEEEEEGEREEGAHHEDPNSTDQRLQILGHHGEEREVGESKGVVRGRIE
jgi:hypothetical protein